MISISNIRSFALCVFVVLLSLHGAISGELNPTRSIGDEAPSWENLPGTDEKEHSSKDLEKFKAVVVAFTCNSCPYAVDYEERINQLAKKYSSAGSQVAVIAINVNKVEKDLLPAMKIRAEERSFVFPYLLDETQKVAKEFGAGRTPEFFVLDQSRKIRYMGAFDDNTNADSVTKRYVQDAITAVLGDKPVSIRETPPVGCAIRYDKERRK